MDTKSPAIKKACIEKLQKISKNRRHQIKKDFFDNAAPGELSIKSPVEGLPDDQWQELLKLWSTERHKVCCPWSHCMQSLMYLMLFACTCSQLLFTSK
jgi:hypothetical protein